MLDQNVFQEILYNWFFCLNIFFTKKYIHQIFKKIKPKSASGDSKELTFLKKIFKKNPPGFKNC